MRMRKKPNLIPRMQRCARLLIPAPEIHRGGWRTLMPQAEALHAMEGLDAANMEAEEIIRRCLKKLVKQ